MLGRTLLLSLDCSHFTLNLYLIMLTVKQGGVKNHFWVFGTNRPGIEPRSPGPLANNLPKRTIGRHTHTHTHIYIKNMMCVFSLSRHRPFTRMWHSYNLVMWCSLEDSNTWMRQCSLTSNELRTSDLCGHYMPSREHARRDGR